MHAEDEVAWLDATAQAELVARGEVSASELVDAAIARVEALDGMLNALPLRMFEEARERASGPLSGPFAGVPFVLKDLGASMHGEPYTAGLKVLAREGFRGHDLLLSATLLTPPLPFGSMDFDPSDPLGVFDVLHEFLPFTPIANMTGQPAISLPLSWNEDGLPVGVHLMAAYGREDALIGLAAELEEARPWASRWPDLRFRSPA